MKWLVIPITILGLCLSCFGDDSPFYPPDPYEDDQDCDGRGCGSNPPMPQPGSGPGCSNYPQTCLIGEQK